MSDFRRAFRLLFPFTVAFLTAILVYQGDIQAVGFWIHFSFWLMIHCFVFVAVGGISQNN